VVEKIFQGYGRKECAINPEWKRIGCCVVLEDVEMMSTSVAGEMRAESYPSAQ
jgi:hypothetical protein